MIRNDEYVEINFEVILTYFEPFLDIGVIKMLYFCNERLNIKLTMKILNITLSDATLYFKINV